MGGVWVAHGPALQTYALMVSHVYHYETGEMGDHAPALQTHALPIANPWVSNGPVL